MAQKRIVNQNRLDIPSQSRRSLKPSYDSERFGEISEKFARFIGTARFLVYMTVFDGYPFIFLTLILSLQASYAAPLILLAQNRQADRDRVQYQEDRTRDERTQADAEYLTREIAALRSQIQQVATRDFVRGEMKDLLEEIVEKINLSGKEKAK